MNRREKIQHFSNIRIPFKAWKSFLCMGCGEEMPGIALCITHTRKDSDPRKSAIICLNCCECKAREKMPMDQEKLEAFEREFYSE